uniref:Uncharacterized protein n=1 Tax=Rhizophora mucronata TaxID=61149 RepID=A0A2P2PVN8_RHIMU
MFYLLTFFIFENLKLMHSVYIRK